MKSELIEYLENRIYHLTTHPHVKPFVLSAKLKELRLMLEKVKNLNDEQE